MNGWCERQNGEERESLLGRGRSHLHEEPEESRITFFRYWKTTASGIITVLVLASIAFRLFRVIDSLDYGNEEGDGFSASSSSSSNSGFSNQQLQQQHNCGGPLHPPCWFEKADVYVPTNQEGFPSFWTYGGFSPMDVTFDGRSFFINGDRVLFLSGSLHPSRATMDTWNLALEEAVRHGLNMITLYVMWAEHQPFPDQEIDWKFALQSQDCNNDGPIKCEWNLAAAIRAAANRGLFVHARIGPYACAEYNYGGIPEWVPLEQPTMDMRRLNSEWKTTMETFVTQVIDYFTANHLWAYQGGPIVMGQIENEIGSNPNETFAPNATLQDYTNWCGALASRLAPQVIWTMCSGLTADNTIATCDGLGDCSTSWLENHGNTGRIQNDQPAMLTELEGGFQVWGEEASRPTFYFWGQTARDMAYDVLRWFARGGLHMNYYMWWGGYNRRRAAALGVANWYANDAFLCSSGQRHEPKYSHFRALHEALIAIAPTLLYAPSALQQNETVEHLTQDGLWEFGTKQRLFRYVSDKRGTTQEIVFVENDENVSFVVRVVVSSLDEPKVFRIMPYSAVLLVNGYIAFDSSDIDPDFTSFERFTKFNAVEWQNISECNEVMGAPVADPMTVKDQIPKEQTALNMDSRVFSDYAWYETEFEITLGQHFTNVSLMIDTQLGSAFTAYIDNVFVGSALNFTHGDGNCTLAISLDQDVLSEGLHTLSLLSESLGYLNLIGRWGASTRAKTKGLTGTVQLVDVVNGVTLLDMVDGQEQREWRSFPGLHGEQSLAVPCPTNYTNNSTQGSASSSLPSWWSAKFATPKYDPHDEALFVDITSGRGHLWLNGNDLGKYWNITRGTTDVYSQRYYLLPHDLLLHPKPDDDDDVLNELLLFDSLGGNHTAATTTLLLSKVESSKNGNFKDEVDYPFACI